MSVVQGTMGVIRSGGTGCQPGIERREVAGVNPPARKRFETQIKRFLEQEGRSSGPLCFRCEQRRNTVEHASLRQIRADG